MGDQGSSSKQIVQNLRQHCSSNEEAINHPNLLHHPYSTIITGDLSDFQHIEKVILMVTSKSKCKQ